MTLPTIVIFFIGQKYFMQGIVTTGLKMDDLHGLDETDRGSRHSRNADDRHRPPDMHRKEIIPCIWMALWERGIAQM